MGKDSAIEWTDDTWNPIVGCSVVSPGCTNCYAMRVAGARTKHTAKYEGLTKTSKAGPVWTGETRLWERALTDPLKWREPRRVFVNSMGDLFHESIPDTWIDRVFAVMALAPQHTFQVLTKRAERMREYFAARSPELHFRMWGRANPPATLPITLHEAEARLFGSPEQRALYRATPLAWPLPNVWLGVSCEDQRRYDERREHLRDTPAAVHFFSFEPLLGPIFADYLGEWAIVGGESGPHARPMHPVWAHSLRDQCTTAGVPFFFKQWGEWHPCEMADNGACYPMPGHAPFDSWKAPIFDPDATDGWNWRNLGKKASGRLLDGRTWDEFPESRP